jgi:hypothetical protein
MVLNDFTGSSLATVRSVERAAALLNAFLPGATPPDIGGACTSNWSR